jgi:hypothetical protein
MSTGPSLAAHGADAAPVEKKGRESAGFAAFLPANASKRREDRHFSALNRGRALLLRD